MALQTRLLRAIERSEIRGSARARRDGEPPPAASVAQADFLDVVIADRAPLLSLLRGGKRREPAPPPAH